MTDKEKIVNAFHKIKAMGWVQSHRSNNTGIGKTFEDYIGVIENNLNEPDLFGFEIKSHRVTSSSYVTLFTKAPSFPSKGANAYLKDQYGECYPNSKYKKLHTSMFANTYNSYVGKYSFRLINKSSAKRIHIGVYTLGGTTLLDDFVYYTYSDIESALVNKLHALFFVTVQRRFNAFGQEEFYFDSAEIYTNPSLDTFLQMIDNGDIMYDIRMGAYQSGSKQGLPHDHGSGFRIKGCNMIQLYSAVEGVQ